jgi:NADH-quinone oxidoreductase subunit G
MTASEIFHKPVKNYFLFNLEPGMDGEGSASLCHHLMNADFVVAATPFVNERMLDFVDVLLPLAIFAETSGTYINAEGRWQGFNGAVSPAGDARPGWKLLRVLGNLVDKEGFEHMSSEEVREELKGYLAKDTEFTNRYEPVGDLQMPAQEPGIRAIGYTPIYAVDGLARRAEALQQTGDAKARFIIAGNIADDLGVGDGDLVIVRQGDVSSTLPVEVDALVPPSRVFVPRGVKETLGMEDRFGAIEVVKV